jgi:hypothetical protein
MYLAYTQHTQLFRKRPHIQAAFSQDSAKIILKSKESLRVCLEDSDQVVIRSREYIYHGRHHSYQRGVAPSMRSGKENYSSSS